MADVVESLMEALRCLPGVGPKSAQRMAFHILERDRNGAKQLAQTILHALERVQHCQRCRNFTERTICALCANTHRDSSTLCVVETPADLMAVEKATGYRGLYFVLMGRLSPIDGIGPEALGLHELEQRFASGEVREVILATSSTVEGETTAMYVHHLAQAKGIKVTRIAYGVPLGGELEYVDSGTLSRAFSARQTFS
jgi:recombination protein RecR